MTDKQKEAIKILNRIRKTSSAGVLSEEEYMTILEAIWDNDVKDKVQIQPFPFVPSYQLPCYHPDGVCINPQRDCINCPKQGTYGSTWTSNTTINKENKS